MIITESQIENADGSLTAMVFLDDENGTGYSMTKAHYEAQQLEHLTESLPASKTLIEQTQ